MKKIVLVPVMAIILSVGAFAGHPSGWGLGFMGQFSLAWEGFGAAGGGAISLRAPHSPTYLGLSIARGGNGFGISLTGDNLVIDRTIDSGLNLGFYVGPGIYAGANIRNFNTDSDREVSLRAGLRLPIGIYIFPLDFLEVFFDIAPSLGVGLTLGDNFGFNFPDGGIGADIGFRLWF